MTKTNKVFEIEMNKEKILLEDFQKILSDFNNGDECVLDFSKTKSFDPSTEAFRLILDQMILKSSNIVLLGPECFEKLVEDVKSDKFHFILKSLYTPKSDVGDTWEELISLLSEDFFDHYFKLTKPPGACQVDSYAVAGIEIRASNKYYQLGLVMGEKALHNAIEKVLLIQVDPSFGDCKDLAAEVLNMMCGHLRAQLKQHEFDIKMGIPECIFTEFKFPPSVGKFWIFQDQGNQMGLFLKEVQNVCA